MARFTLRTMEKTRTIQLEGNSIERFIVNALYRSCERMNPLQHYFEEKITLQVQEAGETLQGCLLADLHTHSLYSDGMHTPDHIARKAKIRGLGAVAITDHLPYVLPFLPRASRAPPYPLHFSSCEKAAERYGIPVIPSMEVASLEGHLLALFPTYHPPESVRYIRNGLPARQTIRLIHQAGGVAIAAHVLRRDGLRATVYEVKDIIDGVEEYNPSAGYVEPYLAEKLGVAEVAGSDSHTKMSIGLALTGFPRAECTEKGAISLNRLVTCIKQRKTTSHIMPISLVEAQVNKTRWLNPFYAIKSIVEMGDDEQRIVPRKIEANLVY